MKFKNIYFCLDQNVYNLNLRELLKKPKRVILR